MQKTPGGENICLLLDYVEDKKDLWLIYELCPGKTMNEELFEVKGKYLIKILISNFNFL